MSENVRSTQLSPKQAKAIDALMSTRTLAEAATEAQISERQLRRWLDTPLFRAELRRVQGRTWEVATARLLGGVELALLALRAGMLAGDVAPAQVRAADRWLSHARAFWEFSDLEERMQALEKRINDSE